MKNEMDKTSEVGKTIKGDWDNGPWRQIKEGEIVPDEHRLVGSDKTTVMVPVRLYGPGVAAEAPAKKIEEVATQEPHLIDLNSIRLSRGAARVVQDARTLGIDPAPALETASAARTGSKICVKGPIADLRATVNMAKTTRGQASS